jgi:hypothetical protein
MNEVLLVSYEVKIFQKSANRNLFCAGLDFDARKIYHCEFSWMDGWVSLVALHHKPDKRPSVSVIAKLWSIFRFESPRAS